MNDCCVKMELEGNGGTLSRRRRRPLLLAGC